MSANDQGKRRVAIAGALLATGCMHVRLSVLSVSDTAWWEQCRSTRPARSSQDEPGPRGPDPAVPASWPRSKLEHNPSKLCTRGRKLTNAPILAAACRSCRVLTVEGRNVRTFVRPLMSSRDGSRARRPAVRRERPEQQASEQVAAVLVCSDQAQVHRCKHARDTACEQDRTAKQPAAVLPVGRSSLPRGAGAPAGQPSCNYYLSLRARSLERRQRCRH